MHPDQSINMSRVALFELLLSPLRTGKWISLWQGSQSLKVQLQWEFCNQFVRMMCQPKLVSKIKVLRSMLCKTWDQCWQSVSLNTASITAHQYILTDSITLRFSAFIKVVRVSLLSPPNSICHFSMYYAAPLCLIVLPWPYLDYTFQHWTSPPLFHLICSTWPYPENTTLPNIPTLCFICHFSTQYSTYFPT